MDSSGSRAGAARLGSWLAAVLALAAGIGFVGEGGFAHFGLAFLAVGLGVLLLLAAALAAIHARRQGPIAPERKRRLRGWVVIAGSIVLVTVLSFWIGVYVGRHTLERAMAWCEAQVPAIDAYGRIHDHYPSTLAEVADLEAAPARIRASGFEFRVRDGHYSFDLWTGPLSGWVWSSARRCWRYYD